MITNIYIKMPTPAGCELSAKVYEARSTVDFCRKIGNIVGHIERYSKMIGHSIVVRDSVKRIAGPSIDDISEKKDVFAKGHVAAFVDASNPDDVKLAHRKANGDYISCYGAAIARNMIETEYINR